MYPIPTPNSPLYAFFAALVKKDESFFIPLVSTFFSFLIATDSLFFFFSSSSFRIFFSSRSMMAPSSSARPRFRLMLSDMLRRAWASARSFDRADRCASRGEKSGVGEDLMMGWREGGGRLMRGRRGRCGDGGAGVLPLGFRAQAWGLSPRLWM